MIKFKDQFNSFTSSSDNFVGDILLLHGIWLSYGSLLKCLTENIEVFIKGMVAKILILRNIYRHSAPPSCPQFVTSPTLDTIKSHVKTDFPLWRVLGFFDRFYIDENYYYLLSWSDRGLIELDWRGVQQVLGSNSNRGLFKQLTGVSKSDIQGITRHDVFFQCLICSCTFIKSSRR